ncbi:M50 family metallopeptidase [Arthrobacter castelli]|uniref:M50 family metallopeptidase n=1 Tax=Arthrobacter castelli TaxID=271431 RepID=UPI0003FF6844|nr:M50 family metallopeptidase [Arthrobacter castelli]
MDSAPSLAGQWFDRLLDGFTQATPVVPSQVTLLAIVAAAVVLAVPKATWRYFGLFVTVIHELGHAFAGLFTGQRLTGIRIHSDQSGSTHSLGRGGWRLVWTGFWGYPAPALVGAALIWCALSGWHPAALSVSAVVIAVTLLFIRNWYGVLVILGCVLASAALLIYVDRSTLGYITLMLGVALVVGAVRDWLNVAAVHVRRRRELASSDAYILYRRTGVAAGVWLAMFGAVIAAAAGFSVWSLKPVLASGQLFGNTPG